MKPLYLAVLTAVTAAPAFAECTSPETTFMSCTFQNGAKSVHVCLEGSAVTYAFGRVGEKPELALSVPVSDADYTPWPGISSVWEAMTFHVDAFSYVASAGVNRTYPENEDQEIQAEVWGNVEVYQNYSIVGSEKILATLTCDKGSVEFSWSEVFSKAKQSVGQCWSSYDQSWLTCE